MLRFLSFQDDSKTYEMGSVLTCLPLQELHPLSVADPLIKPSDTDHTARSIPKILLDPRIKDRVYMLVQKRAAFDPECKEDKEEYLFDIKGPFVEKPELSKDKNVVEYIHQLTIESPGSQDTVVDTIRSWDAATFKDIIYNKSLKDGYLADIHMVKEWISPDSKIQLFLRHILNLHQRLGTKGSGFDANILHHLVELTWFTVASKQERALFNRLLFEDGNYSHTPLCEEKKEIFGHFAGAIITPEFKKETAIKYPNLSITYNSYPCFWTYDNNIEVFHEQGYVLRIEFSGVNSLPFLQKN